MDRHDRPWGAALALALVLSLATQARAQEAGPTKHFSARQSFKIPVAIDDAERANLSELRLYVKRPAGEWAIASNGPATEKSFTFQSTEDGEYWFNIVTVDRAGKALPEDPRRMGPALVVIVDTAPPGIEIKPMTGGNRVYLQCKIQDPNPDYDSLKVQYQKTDGTWAQFEPLADAPGVVQVPDPQLLIAKIKAQVGDRAGNIIEREVDLSSSGVAGSPPRKLPTPEDSAPVKLAGLPEPPGPGVRSVGEAPAGAMPGTLPLPAPGEELRPPLPNLVSAPVFADRPPPPPVIQPTVGTTPRVEYGPPAESPIVQSPDLAKGGSNSAIINTTRCRLEFALDPVPGGIAQVEVHASTDSGRAWKLVGESKDGKSPAVVDFPGEGKYAIAFVVRPNKGLTSALPRAGEAPDGYLEIDTTLPIADLITVTPGTGADAGLLLINWTAKDANLGDTPITCWYATEPGGPWQVIAERIPNSGNYRWALPRSIGSQVWVRLEARDRAGNATRCETTQPVALEGPRAKVRVLSIGPARE